MALPPVSTSLGLNASIAQAREQLADLQRQLATGERVTTYSQLGSERTQVLSFQREIAQIGAYQDTISLVNIRLDVMQQALTRMSDLATTSKSEAFVDGLTIEASGQTTYQIEVAGRFDELVTLLNSDIAGRHLFSGRDTDGPPVVPASEILDGAGARAGYKQIAAERRLADLGADGRGRLLIPAAAGATSSISEDAAGSPFGFKLAAVNSTLTGTTVTGPAGAPAALDVTFSTTLPQASETIQLTLGLPDGTQQNVTLTAVTTSPPGPGEFTIGADENATAANFQAALDQAIQDEAQRSLSAASLFAAADNFFDFDSGTPPQRVNGPPFETATSLVDGTAANTVFWYQGELSATAARQSSLAKADDSQVVAYGARANEEAFRTTLKQFAVIATDTYSASDPVAGDRYREIRLKAAGALSFDGAAQSLDQINLEIISAKTILDDANTRHTANKGMLQGLVEEKLTPDTFEVSAQILALQGRLEASLQISASLSRLSLVNFI